MTSLDEILAAVTEVAGTDQAVVLIDGGAGAGKTTLATALAQAWPGAVQLVSMDDFYPGWGGLGAASAAVALSVLHPFQPGYRRWDWETSRPSDWVRLDPNRALIVEGCGAITPASRALADLAIWCELDEDERHRRAIARDGDLFAPHWQEWERQEAEHWQLNRPRELADLVVSTAS